MRDQQAEMHSEVSQKCVTSGGAILDDASASTHLSSLPLDPRRCFDSVSQSGLDLLAGVCTSQSFLPGGQCSESDKGFDFHHAVTLLHGRNDIIRDDVTSKRGGVDVAGSKQISDSDTESESGEEQAAKRRRLPGRATQSGSVGRRRRKRKRSTKPKRPAPLSDSEPESESKFELASNSKISSLSDRSFTKSSLSNCNLSNCYLSHCSLTDCTLSECILSKCILSECTLSNCSVTDHDNNTRSNIQSVGSVSETVIESVITENRVPVASEASNNGHNARSDSSLGGCLSNMSGNESCSSTESDTNSNSDTDSGAESDSESDNSDEETNPCRSGTASRELAPIPRKGSVGTSLFRKLMLCRLLSDDNVLNQQCCCMECNFRWATSDQYPAWRFKNEYRYDDGLRAEYFSWGRWTKAVKSEVVITSEPNLEKQGFNVGDSLIALAWSSSGCSDSESDISDVMCGSDCFDFQNEASASAAVTADDLIGPVSDSDTDSESENECGDIDLSALTARESNMSEIGDRSLNISRSSGSCSSSDSNSDSDSDSGSDSGSDSDSCSCNSSGSSCSCSSDSESGSDSTQSDSESEADDSERVIDLRYEPNPCPQSCPCSRSSEPEPPTAIIRRQRVGPPLYRCLLRDRLLRRENTARYTCCLYACQNTWRRRHRRSRRRW